MAARYWAINPRPRPEVSDSNYEPCPGGVHSVSFTVQYRDVEEADYCIRCGKRLTDWRKIGNR